MGFKTSDFKKTTRTSAGERILYPYQIRDDRYTAAISYAIAYYERMVGRRRAEFESEALLEFFGDPRLARGLVACLSQTYTWQIQRFADAVGEPVAAMLHAHGIHTPVDIRRRLYGLANGRYSGVILPHERDEALAYLCERLQEQPEGRELRTIPATQLTAAQIETALTLDAEDQRVLVKLGPTPTPEAIIARYNYHSLETALGQAEWLRLQLRGPIWSIIRSTHSLARRYKIRYEVGDVPRTLFDEQLDLTIHGGRDALGSWTRSGRRIARLLLRLLASHPGSLKSGEARVRLGSQNALLRLDQRMLSVLGEAAQTATPESESWDEALADQFRRSWARAFVGGRAAGWRLRRDPEPLVGRGALVVPDFLLLRGDQRVALCLAPGRAVAVELLRDLGRLSGQLPAIVITPDQVAETLSSCPAPLVTYAEQPAEGIPALVNLLERRYPRARANAPSPWQALEQAVASEGFVGEETVAALLGCPTDEALKAVQRWGGAGLHVLPRLGVCSPEALPEIRQMIEQGAA